MGAQLDDFEVAGLIHRGESGFVYLGTDRSSLTQLAVKEYLPRRLADRMADGNIGVRSIRFRPAFRDGLQGFLDQSRILAALDEPALVRIFRTWEQCGTAYTAMPLYQGRSLGDTLRAMPGPSEAWLKVMLGPLLDALAALHRSGCYPCDVTPENVFVSDSGPLLFDIGIVRRILARSNQRAPAVRDRTHAAIEQYSPDPSMPVGPWTDIYAVASLLRLAITGEPPASPIARIESDRMQPLDTTTHGYSELFLDGVNRGLAVRPQHRPQSIEEFREALGIRSLESAPIPVREPLSFASPAPVADVGGEAQPRAPVLDEEPTDAAAPEQVSPTVPPVAISLQLPEPQTTTRRRFGASPKIVGVSLVAVALIGLGVVWKFGGPREVAKTVENATPVTGLASEQSSSPERTSTLPAQPVALAVSVDAPTAATLAPATSNATAPAARLAEPTTAAATVAKSTPPAPKTGKIQFAIKPWGEILVDGKRRGVSPPLKELSLPEGRHRIEIRNSTFSGYAGDVDVKAGRSVSIAHSFASP